MFNCAFEGLQIPSMVTMTARFFMGVKKKNWFFLFLYWWLSDDPSLPAEITDINSTVSPGVCNCVFQTVRRPLGSWWWSQWPAGRSSAGRLVSSDRRAPQTGCPHCWSSGCSGWSAGWDEPPASHRSQTQPSRWCGWSSADKKNVMSIKIQSLFPSV